MTDPPPGVERRHLSKEDFYRAVREDIDPLKHAGEGWFAVDEYFPQDIKDPHVLGDIPGAGEDYYPPPVNPLRRRRR